MVSFKVAGTTLIALCSTVQAAPGPDLLVQRSMDKKCRHTVGDSPRKLFTNDGVCVSWDDMLSFTSVSFEYKGNFPLYYDSSWCTVQAFEDSDCQGKFVGQTDNVSKSWLKNKDNCVAGFKGTDGSYGGLVRSLRMMCQEKYDEWDKGGVEEGELPPQDMSLWDSSSGGAKDE